jgi:hypothetical protein
MLSYLTNLTYSVYCGNKNTSLSVGDVDCYVFNIKLFDSTFNVLPVCICLWEIPIYLRRTFLSKGWLQKCEIHQFVEQMAFKQLHPRTQHPS